MYSLLGLLAIFSIAACVIGGAVLILEGQSVAILCFIGAFICFCGAYKCLNHYDDFKRSLNTPQKIEYGVVVSASTDSITIDSKDISINSDVQKVDTKGLKIGEFVKADYVEGEQGSYLISVESIEQKD